MTSPIGKRSYFGATPSTTLAANCGSTDLLLDINTISPSSWPDTTWGPFAITIDPGGAEERVLVSSLTTGAFTVPVGGRGRDGTSAQSHLSGVKIIHGWDSESAQDANNHINDTTRNDHPQYSTSLTFGQYSSGGGTALANEWSQVIANAATLTLPTAPKNGTVNKITNYANNAAPNTITVAAGGSDVIHLDGNSGGISSFAIPMGAIAEGIYFAGFWYFTVSYPIKPYALCGHTTAATLPANTIETIPILSGTGTTLAYGFAISGSGIAVPVSGLYHCDYGASCNDASGAVTTPIVSKNGSSVLFGQAGPSGNVSGQAAQGTGSGDIVCAAGDVLTLQALQTNGTTQSSSNNPATTYLHAYFIGPA